MKKETVSRITIDSYYRFLLQLFKFARTYYPILHFDNLLGLKFLALPPINQSTQSSNFLLQNLTKIVTLLLFKTRNSNLESHDQNSPSPAISKLSISKVNCFSSLLMYLLYHFYFFLEVLFHQLTIFLHELKNYCKKTKPPLSTAKVLIVIT